jgi:hypothetical protein
MSRIFNPLPALPIITVIMLNIYLITVRTPDLAELDKVFNRYVTHFQSFASLAYYHNNYVKYISYYRKNTGLG